MRFLRTEGRPLRTVCWVLGIPAGTIGGWNQWFDDDMRPYAVSDQRGKTRKVTIEIVRKVVDSARGMREEKRRIRIRGFVKIVKEQLGIDLGRKTVTEILIANDLWKAETRRRRPRFYQSLCRRIPNGLLSLDGSELVVFIDGIGYRFNVELAVDVGSFCHTGYGIQPTETAHAVMEAIERHRCQWGTPLGVVFDSGSANLSDEVCGYLRGNGIEIVPVGPGNPKGNGTDEGAFSQMKKTLGTIRVNASCPQALAKSILDMVVSLYIRMRNQMGLRRTGTAPVCQMEAPVTDEQREQERKRIVDHLKTRNSDGGKEAKIARLNWVIEHHRLAVEPDAFKRAQYCIGFYEMEAISRSEEAFLKAVKRDPRKASLPYFFGILRNIQLQLDDEQYRTYCRQRYNHEEMLKAERRLQEQQKPDAPASIEDIVNMGVCAVTKSLRRIRELAIRRVEEWTGELVKSVRYIGRLKKQFIDAIGAIGHLDENQKESVWKLIERFLMAKTGNESVTQLS